MTSIHDDDASSPEGDGSEKLLRAHDPADVLTRRKDELEVIVAVAGLGFCRVDGMSRSLNANLQFKAEFGWPPDAHIGWRALIDRIGPEDRIRFAEATQAALASGVDLEIVVQAVWPDEARQWVALRGRVLADATGQTDLVLTSRNVTRERLGAEREAAEGAAAIERERQLRADAQASNRGKDEFLSVFSHELRSPLNAILGWNRILTLKRPDDSEVASITARIEHSARVQLKMVNDLLDLGRIETGKLRIEPRPMQLAQVISAAIELGQPAAAAKGISITAHYEPDAGRLRGDPDRLQQLVANLLSNAVKFTPSGGAIVVTLRNVEGCSELAVQDTGQGIAPELLPFIFDRFRQGDSSTTRHSGGLGLGLALVREIVTLHGGSVAVSSAGIGTGARFVVRFPARQPWKSPELKSSAEPAAVPSDSSLRGLSILVVDDEADARTVVAETLKLDGARVTVTDSAFAALAKVQEAGAHFDIIVTDIGMPDEDGYSLVRRLRALQTGRQMLAIAVTGYASKSDVAAALDAGFDLHVPKPVDFNTFVPLVRRLAHAGRGVPSKSVRT
jgi:signal transduction histidine kinase/ActR/RegA family two-component response regulator